MKKYNEVSVELQSIPWRIIVEAAVLWLPILFHGFYGIYIWWTGKSNAIGHPWMANWLYVLQRWTGMIALVFIFWHVYLERFVGQGRTNYAGFGGCDVASVVFRVLHRGSDGCVISPRQRALEFRL